MVKANIQIKWSLQAKEAVKTIYQYYKPKSEQAAKNIRTELLEAPKSIVFARQYQVDEINSKYRRIIVRHWKILYKEEGNTVHIIDVISTRQSTEILENL